ncbi:TIGR01440 family protein [Gracilibacillus sp. S3-1-1]|uniref:TIGR01440 family protein n=1 Tax=Gracilibacillus pellucidus TaxID=3095368 RepID=A0ACC6M9Z1_9BACI|nr:TIGR01440 family protein [Gracilibacillus sp. S3-1-1]MDX8047723.1 TIGR01440 family protein [Gracilibacillus sp. S3-1-1]
MQTMEWENDVKAIVDEWISLNFLTEGDLFVIGCSTSEVAGEHIGTAGSEEVAVVIFRELNRLKEQTGVHLCFQCCEHLNRAIVLEKSVMREHRLDEVAVQPVRHAGGSMATYAYEHLNDAVVVETIQADAGIDIGETMIGMHLKRVAVPLRLEKRYVGKARTTNARTRPKLIGGPRAVYPD